MCISLHAGARLLTRRTVAEALQILLNGCQEFRALLEEEMRVNVSRIAHVIAPTGMTPFRSHISGTPFRVPSDYLRPHVATLVGLTGGVPGIAPVSGHGSCHLGNLVRY